MTLPITTKQIDGMLFDEQMNTSAYSDHKYRSSGPVKIKRGQSQGSTAVHSQMSLHKQYEQPRRKVVHSASRKQTTAYQPQAHK